jgi:hypothetical protein
VIDSEQEMQAAQHTFLERRRWWLEDTTRDARLEREYADAESRLMAAFFDGVECDQRLMTTAFSTFKWALIRAAVCQRKQRECSRCCCISLVCRVSVRRHPLSHGSTTLWKVNGVTSSYTNRH